MATRNRIKAAWRIATAASDLKSKIRLMIYLNEYRDELAQEIEQDAIEQGNLHSLIALRDVVAEREDDARKHKNSAE